jgi:hypothetical protein
MHLPFALPCKCWSKSHAVKWWRQWLPLQMQRLHLPPPLKLHLAQMPQAMLQKPLQK